MISPNNSNSPICLTKRSERVTIKLVKMSKSPYQIFNQLLRRRYGGMKVPQETTRHDFRLQTRTVTVSPYKSPEKSHPAEYYPNNEILPFKNLQQVRKAVESAQSFYLLRSEQQNERPRSSMPTRPRSGRVKQLSNSYVFKGDNSNLKDIPLEGFAYGKSIGVQPFFNPKVNKQDLKHLLIVKPLRVTYSGERKIQRSTLIEKKTNSYAAYNLNSIHHQPYRHQDYCAWSQVHYESSTQQNAISISNCPSGDIK